MTNQTSVTIGDWVHGARLRTLPLAVAPVVLGTGSALWADSFDVWLFVLCVAIAVSLQVGVNFANDYSDGIRGTDAHRVGPARLTGSGLVDPQMVKKTAWFFLGLAVVVGLVVVVVTGIWWFLAIGAVCVLAAWFYTGGRRPYGYAGLGEVVVFVFFGLVATTGTAWVMIGSIPGEAWFTGSAAGFFAAAVLLVNNLRDLEQDAKAGKRTLAVKLGPALARVLLVVLLALPYGIVAVLQLIFVQATFVFVLGIMTGVIMVIVVWSKKPAELVLALGLMSLNSLLFACALAWAIAF